MGSNVQQHAALGRIFLPGAGPRNRFPAVEGRFQVNDAAHQIFTYKFIECLKVAVPTAVMKWDQMDAAGLRKRHQLGNLGGSDCRGFIDDDTLSGFENLPRNLEVGCVGGSDDE